MTPDGRVLCQATVDAVSEFVWEVTVWGQKPFDVTRIYTITAKDDNSAAFDGIGRFTAEMEQLRDASSKD